MKNKKLKKIVSGTAGAALLLSGYAQPADQTVQTASKQSETAMTQDGTTMVQEGYTIRSAVDGTESYTPVAYVQGRFSFDQEQLTPADEAFNLFGTVLTGICAKPAFALENDRCDFYINVGGRIQKAYSVSLKNMADKEETKTMLCSCATGAASANVRATGILISDILQLAETIDDVNAVTFLSADGYGQTLPLSYVLEKEAMIVYRIGGESLPSGTQLYIPETVAKYFTRNVVDIELTREEVLPEVESRDESLRAEVTIRNAAEDCTFGLDEAIVFEGYADDLGDPIAAVEFSMDGGETWTSCETPDATPERWVYWHFEYQPEAAGTYQLLVRARTQGGHVSPLAASLRFAVAE